MSKKKKNKQSKLQYIPFGDMDFGMEEMFAQGAAALDIAAVMAIKIGDIDSLIRIGNEWTRMASAISDVQPKADEKVKVGFGFSCEQEVEEDVDDQSISTHNNQSGKLRKRGY